MLNATIHAEVELFIRNHATGKHESRGVMTLVIEPSARQVREAAACAK